MDTGARIWSVFLDGHIIYQEHHLATCLSSPVVTSPQTLYLHPYFLESQGRKEVPGKANLPVNSPCHSTCTVLERKPCLEGPKRPAVCCLYLIDVCGDQFFYVQGFVLSLHNVLSLHQQKAGEAFKFCEKMWIYDIKYHPLLCYL